MGRHSIAVIGVGKITRDQHLPSIAASAAFELVAVVSGSGAQVAGVPSFARPAELYAAMPNLDSVALNMPPHVRHGFAREALLAGKHVLIEKPPTASIAELDDLVRLAAERKRVLFATWHSRFNQAVARAREILERDGVKAARIDWREDVRKWHPGQDWVWAPGGFGVFDPGINALSILTEIMPGDVFVTGAKLVFPANRQTPIAADLDLRLIGGDTKIGAGFDWRETSGEIWTIEVTTGRGATLKLERGGARLLVDAKVTIDTPPREYQDIYARFAELLAAGRSEVDPRPLWLVADAFLMGERVVTGPFEWQGDV